MVKVFAQKSGQEYEKVVIDEWINGSIIAVQEFKDVEKQYKNDDGEMES